MTLYDLPLEMLDSILQKSYLHWILNSPIKQRDEKVIRSLISVDVCFNQRITKQRFKKAIWRYLKNFYGKTKKRSAIIRNNRNYLLENIQPNDELIDSLLTLNCITEEQSQLIQKQRLQWDKNAELLYVMNSFDEKRFSNFVKCLRRNNQKTVARIIENGGGIIKIEVQTRGAKCTTSMETQLLHQNLEDLRNVTKPRSHQTDKLISQLSEEGIEILNSHLDRMHLVIWAWCHSQSALEHMHWLYESNQLRDIFLANIQPSISNVMSIDRNQFRKTVVVCQISINFTQRIDVGRTESVFEVTKLRNEIYVLCQECAYPHVGLIRVFDDQNPVRLRKIIIIKEIKEPADIESSERETCLYVSDYDEKCIWKITRETDDEHNIIKWLTTDYMPGNLSMSTDGQLLVVNHDPSCILMIYGSDAKLVRFIRLSRDIDRTIHLVETSIGNFIILHYLMEYDVGESGSNGTRNVLNWGISKLTGDGEMVIRRFVPSNRPNPQKLWFPRYISIDSDDRVFVADYGYGRVILLDSDLKWDRIICPTKEEEEEEMNIRDPSRFYYDEENKQLVVGGGHFYLGVGANVYTVNRE